jgi:hypothetical protein
MALPSGLKRYVLAVWPICGHYNEMNRIKQRAIEMQRFTEKPYKSGVLRVTGCF